jgi:hypothetical protein
VVNLGDDADTTGAIYGRLSARRVLCVRRYARSQAPTADLAQLSRSARRRVLRRGCIAATVDREALLPAAVARRRRRTRRARRWSFTAVRAADTSSDAHHYLLREIPKESPPTFRSIEFRSIDRFGAALSAPLPQAGDVCCHRRRTWWACVYILEGARCRVRAGMPQSSNSKDPNAEPNKRTNKQTNKQTNKSNRRSAGADVKIRRSHC